MKSMKNWQRYMLSTIILISAAMVGSAQDEKDVVYLQDRDEMNPDLISSNEAQLLQLGDNNQASVNQRNIGKTNSANLIDVKQAGYNHEVYIDQYGNGNKSLVEQYGEDNRYLLYLNGQENKTRLTQDGEENSVEQYLIGDGMDYQIIQEGYQNELIQIENNPSMPKYQVIQQGDGMVIMIENGIAY